MPADGRWELTRRLKIPVAPAGIEPVIFRRVSQCRNQLPPRTSTRKMDVYIIMLTT